MKILFPYDGSSSADAAIEDLWRAGLPSQIDVLVVSVEDGGFHTHQHSDSMAEAETLAKKARERIQLHFPDWTVSSQALWGHPADVILETSLWWHPDLLIVGSHGRSRVARLFLGSVSLDLLHRARCSVRVTRAFGSPT